VAHDHSPRGSLERPEDPSIGWLIPVGEFGSDKMQLNLERWSEFPSRYLDMNAIEINQEMGHPLPMVDQSSHKL
jgi:hypothetical protein